MHLGCFWINLNTKPGNLGITWLYSYISDLLLPLLLHLLQSFSWAPCNQQWPLNTIWLENQDSRFRIQDSRFKIEKWKYENEFQEKSTRFQKIKICVHNTSIIKLLFHTKICALLRRPFSQKFLKHSGCDRYFW